MSTTLHTQYITDEAGKRVSVVLPIEEFEALTERLEDLEDLVDAREALNRLHQSVDKAIPWEDVRGELAEDRYAVTHEEHVAWCDRLRRLVESQLMTEGGTVARMREEARY
jgi:hypothetical protein